MLSMYLPIGNVQPQNQSRFTFIVICRNSSRVYYIIKCIQALKSTNAIFSLFVHFSFVQNRAPAIKNRLFQDV